MTVICFSGLSGCNAPSEANQIMQEPVPDNSRNALDWDGSYLGLLPCADCEGIQTILTLNKDLSYRLKTQYLGKSDHFFESSGEFSWNEEGNTVILKDTESAGQPSRYFVGENTLTQLDQQGNKIAGELAGKYVLSKTNYALLEKYWKLAELNGKPVITDSSSGKEPHIIFKEKDSRMIGNGGCNNISGLYTLNHLNRITISKTISTQMACPGLELESQFLNVLQTADNFTIAGDTLALNKARMAPLARFVAAYMN